MQYRVATKQDIEALHRLGAAVFGDTDSFVDSTLNEYAGLQNVYVATADSGEVIAQLYAVPCSLNATKGRYLYALATTPAMQGQGVMGKLMEYAETACIRQGASFFALIPANEGLFTFYEKRGYTIPTYWRYVNLQVKSASSLRFEKLAVEAEGLKKLRKKYARKNYIDFTTRQYAVIARDLTEEGIKLALCPKGYLLYSKKEKTLQVAEMFAESDAFANELLEAVAATEHCVQVQATLAENRVLATVGKRQKAALIKNISATNLPSSVYLRFGFEELWPTTS